MVTFQADARAAALTFSAITPKHIRPEPPPTFALTRSWPLEPRHGSLPRNSSALQRNRRRSTSLFASGQK